MNWLLPRVVFVGGGEPGNSPSLDLGNGKGRGGKGEREWWGVHLPYFPPQASASHTTLLLSFRHVHHLLLQHNPGCSDILLLAYPGCILEYWTLSWIVSHKNIFARSITRKGPMRTAFEKRFYSIFVVFFIIVYLLYFIVSRSNISCIAIDILGVLKRCMTTEFGGTRHKHTWLCGTV